MTQPKALFLADVLHNDPASKSHHDEAAFELRRLHAEVERLSWDSIHTCHSECQRPLCKLTRERDALLEALKRLLAAYSVSHSPEHRQSCWDQARAAIKAVEENT